jgi:hypothetical protein
MCTLQFHGEQRKKVIIHYFSGLAKETLLSQVMSALFQFGQLKLEETETLTTVSPELHSGAAEEKEEVKDEDVSLRIHLPEQKPVRPKRKEKFLLNLCFCHF